MLALSLNCTTVPTVISPVETCGAGHGLLGGCILCQQRLYICTESVHALAVLRKPVHHIAVVRSNATLVTFAVADDVLFGQTELLAQVSTKLNGLQINLLEVGAVREIVFTNFESNMRVICSATGVPATVIPRQRLVGSDASVCQLADEAVNTDFSAAGW